LRVVEAEVGRALELAALQGHAAQAEELEGAYDVLGNVRVVQVLQVRAVQDQWELVVEVEEWQVVAEGFLKD